MNYLGDFNEFFGEFEEEVPPLATSLILLTSHHHDGHSQKGGDAADHSANHVPHCSSQEHLHEHTGGEFSREWAGRESNLGGICSAQAVRHACENSSDQGDGHGSSRFDIKLVFS
jgi:hypothetical protein